MSANKAPERLETQRLVLRRPVLQDAEAIFARYAGDPAVAHFVGWPRHRSVADTQAFLEFSDLEWEGSPAGPYLIVSRVDGEVLGSTGLSFETAQRASTGYVLAKNEWGHGYATEALLAMVDVSRALKVRRLYALCHPDHRASWRVLEKSGFMREAILRCYTEFPNLAPGDPGDVLCYARIL